MAALLQTFSLPANYGLVDQPNILPNVFQQVPNQVGLGLLARSSHAGSARRTFSTNGMP